MKRLSWVCAVLLVPVLAYAQGESGKIDFNDIQLERAGMIKGNYKSGRLIDKMSGGVKMTVLGETEAENIQIEAENVDFVYATAEAREPSKIVMRGKVRIVMEGNRFNAGRAEFDLEAGTATFSETPIIENADGMKLQSSLVVLDLDSGDFVMHDGQRVRD